jgi:FlaA1/EpsC-like NDP-sugar epimerase
VSAAVETQSLVRQRLVPRRSHLHPVGDAASWVVALAFFSFARFDFVVTEFPRRGVLFLAPLAAVTQLGVGLTQHLYRGRYRIGSFEEVTGVVTAATVTGCFLLAVDVLTPPTHLLPASVPLSAGAAAVMGMLGYRYLWRTVVDRRRRPRPEHSQRLLVFGAGEGGEQVIRAVLREPASSYYPVGLLDDDPGKRHLRILGVSVLGNRRPASSITRVADAGAGFVPSAGLGPPGCTYCRRDRHHLRLW